MHKYKRPKHTKEKYEKRISWITFSVVNGEMLGLWLRLRDCLRRIRLALVEREDGRRTLCDGARERAWNLRDGVCVWRRARNRNLVEFGLERDDAIHRLQFDNFHSKSLSKCVFLLASTDAGAAVSSRRSHSREIASPNTKFSTTVTYLRPFTKSSSSLVLYVNTSSNLYNNLKTKIIR